MQEKQQRATSPGTGHSGTASKEIEVVQATLVGAAEKSTGEDTRVRPTGPGRSGILPEETAVK
jgi:hypothetical protein